VRHYIKEKFAAAHREKRTAWQVNRVRFIVVAIVLHLVVSTGIYLVGRFSIMPNLVSRNGIIVDDAYLYRKEAVALVEILQQKGVSAWLSASPVLHIKLYSLSYALFGPLLGFNNLSAEPLNLIYFLLILYLVFQLGQEVFDRRVGVLAAALIALWPSFLIITTQLLRDPLFIVALLTLALMTIRCLMRDHSWRSGLTTGAIGGMAGWVLWIVRRPMWEVVLFIVLLGIGFLVIRQLRERRVLARNLAGVALLLVAVISVPQVFPMPRNPLPPSAQTLQDGMPLEESPPPSSEEAVTRPVPPVLTEQPQTPFGYLVARIRRLRQRFIFAYDNSNNGSNLDTDVELNSMTDVVRFLPRAAVIGFFAPFPNMWFAPMGQAARMTRMVAGLETLCMYVIEALALLALWFKRRHLAAWLLFLAAATGVIALGLVVVNIGTLYRMRYAFWMLVIIVGVAGARQALSTLASKKRRPQLERVEASP
jgi:4-amino-4-deoxy-L-arabinose transferase-like glycosyltransferase